MTSRLDYFAAAPDATKALLALEQAMKESSLEPGLRHLVKLRASQINGCAYCVHMHSQEARRDGEDEARLHLLAAWPDSILFTERERAALAWTEALTRVDRYGAPDGVFDSVHAHFDDRGLAELTLLIGVINVWNRLSIGFRAIHSRTWKPA